MSRTKGAARKNAAATPSLQSLNVNLTAQWQRNIRAAARMWAKQYQPQGDMILLKEVRLDLSRWLLANVPRLLKGEIRHPEYMTDEFTWHRVSKDVRPALEEKGYVMIPSLVVKTNGIKEASEYVLMREPLKTDPPQYIRYVADLVRDQKIPRVETMLRNTNKRKEQLERQVSVWEGWLKSKR